MNLLSIVLFFGAFSLIVFADIFPIVPGTILVVLQNISKVLKFNGNFNSYNLFQFNGINFYIKDLLTLSKKELDDELAMRIIRSFAIRSKTALKKIYYNTLTGQFFDESIKSPQDVGMFATLNDSFKLNVFILGTFIKDEFGVEKKVFNGIYICNTATRKTYSLEFDTENTPLKNIASSILAQVPKENNPEKLTNTLVHLHKRIEQVLQFFFQLTENGLFPTNPFSFYQAIIGELLCQVSKKSLERFSLSLSMFNEDNYFQSNWLYLSEYHSQLITNPNEIVLNTALYDHLMKDFSDYDYIIQHKFKGIFGLKNYWGSKATGLNAILQVCLSLKPLIDLVLRANAKQKQTMSQNNLLDEFVRVIEFSRTNNALNIYDSTVIFDILSMKYGELHDVVNGYNVKNMFFAILKELSSEFYENSNQKEIPSALVRGTAKITESSLPNESNTKYEDFEYVVLSSEQLENDDFDVIRYVLENQAFRVASSHHENILVQSNEKISITSFPHILVVEIEGDGSVLVDMPFSLSMTGMDGDYNLRAIVSRYGRCNYDTYLFHADKPSVSIEDTSISLSELVRLIFY